MHQEICAATTKKWKVKKEALVSTVFDVKGCEEVAYFYNTEGHNSFCCEHSVTFQEKSATQAKKTAKTQVKVLKGQMSKPRVGGSSGK